MIDLTTTIILIYAAIGVCSGIAAFNIMGGQFDFWDDGVGIIIFVALWPAVLLIAVFIKIYER